MVQRCRPQKWLEHAVHDLYFARYGVEYRLARLPKTGLFIVKSKMVPEHTALTRPRRQWKENSPNRLRKDLVWTVGDKFLVKGRQLVSSGRPRTVVPCVMKRDFICYKIPRNVLNTRIIEVARRIPGRRIASTAERTSTQFHAKFTTNSRSHVRARGRSQLVKKSSRIAC